MSTIDRFGSKVVAERRSLLREPDLLRLRAAEMYKMKLAGKTSPEIGRVFGVSRQMVNRVLAQMPDPIKKLVERARNRGTSIDLG